MTIFVLTYNTADKPERRIVCGTYTTREKAQDAYKLMKSRMGDFIVDYEINETELDA